MALPVVLASASSRFIERPISRNRDGSLSVAPAAGSGFGPSAFTASPKPIVLPPGPVKRPSASVTSAAGTDQAFATAATSVARVTAAASRIGIHRSRTLAEPPVRLKPTSRIIAVRPQR